MQVRRGHQSLGLCALVICALTVGPAGAAQAETGACFGYTNGGSLPCFGALEPSVAIEPFFSGTLLINNVNLEVLCTGAKFIEGGQLGANGSVLLGRVEFSGCISLSRTPTLTKLSTCTPNDPVAGLGKIRTQKLAGLITLHFFGEPGVLLKPDFGTTLAKIFLGEECAVSEELIINGEFVAEDTFGKESFERHEISHLMREHFFLHLMSVGVNQATIDGSAFVELSGAHSGMKWGGKGA